MNMLNAEGKDPGIEKKKVEIRRHKILTGTKSLRR